MELERIGDVLCIDCKPLASCSKEELVAFIEHSVSAATAVMEQLRADAMLRHDSPLPIM